MMLEELLKVQEKFGSELISPDEIDLIKQIWSEDLIQSHERSK